METFGDVDLPVMIGEQAQLWELILALADRLAPSQWSLIGGQMVSLYAIHADVEWPRVTRDVDMLANMEVLHSNLASCTTALEELGLRAQPDSNGAAYRFSKTAPSSIDVRIDSSTSSGLASNVGRGLRPMRCSEASTSAITPRRLSSERL